MKTFDPHLSLLSCLIVSLLAVPYMHADRPSEEGFDERVAWYTSEILKTEPNFRAKNGASVACARLYASNGEDTDMVRYFADIDRDNAGASDIAFAATGLLRALFAFPELFNVDDREAMGDFLDDFSVWNAYGSETFQWSIRSNGYLAGQAWPERTFSYTLEDGSVEDITGREMQARMKSHLLAEGKRQFTHGYSEFATINYEVFHFAALLNLFDFAEDEDLRTAAAALLDYHVANLALASFDGRVVAPYTRSYGPQGRSAETMQGCNWIHYLYWGQGDPLELNSTAYFAAYLTLSDWRPPATVNRIAKGEVPLPFASRQAAPFKDFTETRYLMRKGYVTEAWAMGAGPMRHDPDKFTIDDAAFGINLRTEDTYASIQAFHPYFYADREPDAYGNMVGGEDFWRPVSPFMQHVSHENAAILLFDIPRFDPWRSRGSWWPGHHENFFTHRNGHYRNLIQLGQTRFPATIDEVVNVGQWWFLREADTYIGIHCLKPGAELDEQEDWTVIKSRNSQTGFVFEIGTSSTSGSFANFQEQVMQNPVQVDWESLSAAYTSSQGNRLEMVFNTSTEEPDASVPETWINGARERFDSDWPVMESPWVHLTDKLLVISMQGEDTVVWDWTGEVPVLRDAVPFRRPVTGELAWAAPGKYEFIVETEVGIDYEVETTTASGEWIPIGSPVRGDLSPLRAELPPGGASALYRVLAKGAPGSGP